MVFVAYYLRDIDVVLFTYVYHINKYIYIYIYMYVYIQICPIGICLMKFGMGFHMEVWILNDSDGIFDD